MRTSIGQTSIRLRQVVIAIIAIATCFDNSVNGAQPGELYELPISDSESIRMRYCPPGSIYPGRPNVARGQSEIQVSPIKMRGYYFGETEVTLGQFRRILGVSGMMNLKTEAARFQAANPQFSFLIVSGDREPAFFVGLADAVRFCTVLQSVIDKKRAELSLRTVEARRVRLPSHVEWQYAGRAISDASQQSKRPHFNRDFKISELTAASQEKCREVWTKLGRVDQFIGSQDQLLILTSATAANEKAKVREILGEIYQKLIGGPPRSSANGIGSVPWDHGKQPSDLPNAWNIYDIHDNVTEWVIWASSSDRRDEIWTLMRDKVQQDQSLTGQPSIFLAGGFYSDSIQNLNHFVLWSGPNVPDGTGSPQEFEYHPDLISEFSPGFRVVMERIVASDWLLSLRSSLFEQDHWSAAAEISLNQNLILFEELAEPSHPGFGTIAFYRGLRNLTKERGSVPAEFFEQLGQVVDETTHTPTAGLGHFIDKLGSSEPSTSDPPVTADENDLFWRTLASLHQTHIDRADKH